MQRIIVIGDIHGCYNTLIALLEKIKYSTDDTIIFLGDYIDRGKMSYEVVEHLIQMQKENNKVICLIGNHEHMFLYNQIDWMSNGGNKTKKSYYKNGAKLNKHIWWYTKLLKYYETNNFYMVHAGMPKQKLEDNEEYDMIWNRDWITDMTEKNDKTVIFGHTPSTNLIYKSLNGNICIDTACVFGYQLTALIIEVDENNNEIIKDVVYQNNIE